MAFSFRIKSFSLARLRPRLGLKGNLFLAFSVIAAMAILISGAASLLLGQLGQTMTELSSRDIPRLVGSFQLSALSESLSSKGPALLDAKNDAARLEHTKYLKETQAAAIAKLREITDLGADTTVVNALEETIKNIGYTITSLGNAVKERLEVASEREKQYDALRAAHSNFQTAIVPEMMAAKTQLNALLSSVDIAADLAKETAYDVERLSTLTSDGNSMAAAMLGAMSATANNDIDVLQKSFEAARKHVDPLFKSLAGIKSAAPLHDAAAKLFAFGEGQASIFKLRQKELDALDYGQLVLEETRKLNRGLEVSVRQLIDDVQTNTNVTTANVQKTILTTTTIMLALGASTLVGAVLFVWLYVGRNILRRIGNLQSVMRRLAGGDLEAAVMPSRQQDEVASMARSLEVFRESMIQARNMSADQDADRQAKTAQAARMEQQIAHFEDSVRASLDSLIGSADSMQTAAQGMSSTAGRSSELANAVASAAEATSINVQTVSSGTGQLSSSIEDISRQVSGSSEIANKAVHEAGHTDSTMQGLEENAARISTVVDLIQTIASQTNLLALNATIEAARAGEAGKGFAVVASEVKNLADQTAKATEEIRSQITQMQQVTSTAVHAIRSIGQTISEMNEYTTTIAAAVEQQGAATREIARSIQQAADGTSNVSSNIVGVSQASTEAGTAAEEVLAASSALRREAAHLREGIHAFLLDIRAA